MIFLALTLRGKGTRFARNSARRETVTVAARLVGQDKTGAVQEAGGANTVPARDAKHTPRDASDPRISISTRTIARGRSLSRAHRLRSSSIAVSTTVSLAGRVATTRAFDTLLSCRSTPQLSVSREVASDMTATEAVASPASSPPVHAAVNGTFQTKRPTLSRFFRRYPYGERRSRAVAPADAMPSATASTGRPRRRKAASDVTKNRDGSVIHIRTHHRVRLLVGEFMRKLYVELFFVIIVLCYGVFVLVQINLAESDLADLKSVIDVTDITVGSILLLEILLKIFAYGLDYLRSGWSLFDAVVIVASFVLGIVAASGTTSIVLLKILRLRVILRILRVLVVFERLKQRSQSMNLTLKHQITTPAEHVLRLLHDLRFHPALRRKVRDDIEFAIDVIKNNRLYDANEDMLRAEGVDDDTQQWLRGEVMKVNDTNKALNDNHDDDDDDEDIEDRSPLGAGSDVTNGNAIAAGNDASHTGTASAHNANRALNGSPTNAMRRSVTMKELLPPLDPAAEFELQSLMLNVGAWGFDVFRVNIVTNGNALCHLGYHLLHEFAPTTLQIEQTTLVAFLMEIQRGYIATNPYHNAIHAADVMQTTYYFLLQPELQPFLRPLDRVLALVSAGIHDFKHDGFNNSFHISTASEIALRYNDHAVLENYHVAQSFLVMKNPEFNLLGKLSTEDFKYAREMIIQMVLATDMAKHFEDVALFKANILPQPSEELNIKNVGDKKLLLKMILHTCDVSNPAKDREIMLRWTERVVEEFFLQGDMEKQLGLAVSPFMDRDTIVLKKMQVGFADFIVSPLFAVWAQILPNVNAGPYRTLQANRDFWFGQSEDFKPHHIKDVVRDLGAKKRMSQAQTHSQGDDVVPHNRESINTGRVRKSVASLLLSSDDA